MFRGMLRLQQKTSRGILHTRVEGDQKPLLTTSRFTTGLERQRTHGTRRVAGFRTFRHSAATIVNQKTGNLKLVQKLLGHSNLSTTADVYAHTSAAADRRAGLALELLRCRQTEELPRTGTDSGSDIRAPDATWTILFRTA